MINKYFLNEQMNDSKVPFYIIGFLKNKLEPEYKPLKDILSL